MVYDKDQRARLYRQLPGAKYALFLPIKLHFKCFRNLDGQFFTKYHYADLGGIWVSSANFKAESCASDVSFLSEFTSNNAGIERGVIDLELKLSTCSGALSTPLLPEVYSKLLQVKTANQGSYCWLLNTGSTEGGYEVGSRIPIKDILAILIATLDNSLLVSCFKKCPNFAFEMPMLVPSFDSCLLVLRGT